LKAKPEKSEITSFEAKSGEIIATGFEGKLRNRRYRF
jgi:hypothetical protein